jgi:hypothetical protein
MGRAPESRGWNLCDWELFPRDQGGHNEIVRQLRNTLILEYGLKVEKFDLKEAAIAWRVGLKGRPYVPHKPDLIVNVGNGPEDRIFMEYVNTLGKGLQNYLRDLRGMLALSAVIRRYRGFLLVIRNSCFVQSYTILRKDSPVESMSLKSFFHSLDRKDYDWLVGRRRVNWARGERRI